MAKVNLHIACLLLCNELNVSFSCTSTCSHVEWRY